MEHRAEVDESLFEKYGVDTYKTVFGAGKHRK
jgi:hypothetical protein